MNERILMIEDESGAALTVGDRLKSEGYRVDFAVEGNEGFCMALEGNYDLILLDVMLPGKDGISICRDLRKKEISTPIIMVTARGEIHDKVLGLKLGADDYLTKPFNSMELAARMEAVLRRNKGIPKISSEGDYSFGPFTLKGNDKELFQGKVIVSLSGREYQLLEYLISHRGEILSRNDLLDHVWGYEAIPSTRTVDVHIAWLRQKLKDTDKSPRYIKTVTKRGYKFIG